jgi:hypothetical protein
MSEAQKQLIKETKLREEKIRNDTIDEYRKKQLLELDLPISHPLEYMGLWDGQHHNSGRSGGGDGGRAVVKIDDKDNRVKFDSYIKQLTNTGNYVNNNNNKADDNDDSRSNNDNIINNISIKKPFIESVGIIQRAIDSEMSAADEVVSKMRSLRTGLGMIYDNAACCRPWVRFPTLLSFLFHYYHRIYITKFS